MSLEKCGWSALAFLMVSTAHAGGTNRHSVMLGMHGDENDNRQWLGKLVLPVGDRAWVQGSLGKTELAGVGARKNIGAALGIDGQAVSAALEFVQRKDDARFEQQDWAAVVDWHGARGGLGADASLRSANGESSAPQQTGVFGSPTTSTIRESADCSGFGLHGHLNPTPRVTVFAGAMLYRCDFEANSAATSTDSVRTPLSPLLGTNAPLSGVWRDQALIDSSYRFGGSYRFQRATVSAQYARDRISKADETLDTLQLEAGLPLSAHWLLSTTIGYSSGKSSPQAGYGGLAISFNW
jgi:hypothetical protein